MEFNGGDFSSSRRRPTSLREELPMRMGRAACRRAKASKCPPGRLPSFRDDFKEAGIHGTFDVTCEVLVELRADNHAAISFYISLGSGSQASTTACTRTKTTRQAERPRTYTWS